MDLKRIFRGWMLAILLVFVLLIVVLKFTGSSQYQKVPTSQVVQQIESGHIKSAILTVPTRVVQITASNNRQLEAVWAGNQINQITAMLQQLSDTTSGNGKVTYVVDNPQGNSLLSVLLGWLPFIVIFLLFFVFMNQM